MRRSSTVTPSGSAGAFARACNAPMTATTPGVNGGERKRTNGERNSGCSWAYEAARLVERTHAPSASAAPTVRNRPVFMADCRTRQPVR
ncbi:hypothetical protein GCM10008937_19810 [Deinococcus depolymerans]|uniref:Uncharacterized protein n=1 Tax=Deinococcus depolymerans TaxID=392408 RepID=A0ABP3M524_9DEIO